MMTYVQDFPYASAPHGHMVRPGHSPAQRNGLVQALQLRGELNMWLG